MGRHYKDWLKTFLEYTAHGEAPKRLYFWSGVSAIAGALQRKVWIDMVHFRWYPNFYIIFVAPPGIVGKSTTAGIAMDLLRKVEGVKFGPSVVTWEALVSGLVKSETVFEHAGKPQVMSALTIESSEFGNLINPDDKQMLDMFVNLYDGKSFDKWTKHSGDDELKNPWVNIIGSTTPSWIADNFSEYSIGGGFTARCLFIYAEAKEQYTAYPKRSVISIDRQLMGERLTEDLAEINKLSGEFEISDEAMDWGELWYKDNYSRKNLSAVDSEYYRNYIARKQTHMHKLAMVISAAQGDSCRIELSHLELAYSMVTDLEADMKTVFKQVGQSEGANGGQLLMRFLALKGSVEYQLAYRQVHAQFPNLKNFEDILAGCVKAGFVRVELKEGVPYLTYIKTEVAA